MAHKYLVDQDIRMSLRYEVEVEEEQDDLEALGKTLGDDWTATMLAHYGEEDHLASFPVETLGVQVVAIDGVAPSAYWEPERWGWKDLG